MSYIDAYLANSYCNMHGQPMYRCGCASLCHREYERKIAELQYDNDVLHRSLMNTPSPNIPIAGIIESKPNKLLLLI